MIGQQNCKDEIPDNVDTTPKNGGEKNFCMRFFFVKYMFCCIHCACCPNNVLYLNFGVLFFIWCVSFIQNEVYCFERQNISYLK